MWLYSDKLDGPIETHMRHYPWATNVTLAEREVGLESRYFD